MKLKVNRRYGRKSTKITKFVNSGIKRTAVKIGKSGMTGTKMIKI